MKSVVDNVKDDLEAQGEYVVLANTNWFAVFPATLQKRVAQAKKVGRGGPNLVVYKTRSADPRDHHVIPFGVIRDLLVEETLSDSAAGGQRWNLTLGDDQLHVSHRAGKIDVSSFRGLPLLVERIAIPSELLEPTADEVEFEKRVRSLRKLPPLARPEGRPNPTKHLVSSRTTYERRPDVKAWVLGEANGRCELCLQPAAFVGDDGEPYLELHHVQRLADGGPDTVENAVAVCPGCHRRLHHGADRLVQRERIYGQVARLVRTASSEGSHG